MNNQIYLSSETNQSTQPTSNIFDACNINQQEIEKLTKDLSILLFPTPGLNPDLIMTTFLTDDFYNKVDKLVTTMEKYTFNNAKCMIQKDPTGNSKSIFCQQINLANDKTTILNNILSKYESIILRILKKTYEQLTEANTYCGINSNDNQKIQRLITKIGLMLATDTNQMEKICNPYCLPQSESVSKLAVCECTQKNILQMLFSVDGYYSGIFFIVCCLIMSLIIILLLFK